MSETISTATAPLGARHDAAAPLSLDADFDTRWAAWQMRGRRHDRVIRRKLFMLAPAVVISAAIAYLFLIR